MYKDSYSQRLKEIREKYGASVKDTAACLRSNDKLYLRHQPNFDDKSSDKYNLNKKLYDTKTDFRNFQNNHPSFTSLSSKISTSILKENDTFLNTQSKDERLQEIEKIRKEFAASRNKTVQEFNRNLQKSKLKNTESNNYVLNQSVNKTKATTFNPQDFKASVKDSLSNKGYRGRSHSTISSVKIEPDTNLNKELRRNYDYESRQEVFEKESKLYDRFQSDAQNLSSYINSSVSDFQTENGGLIKNSIKDYRRADDLRAIKQIDSQTTSPIRGLMKLDSVQRLKKSELPDTYVSVTAAKLSANSYDLTNIDKIQERIQKLLAKK